MKNKRCPKCNKQYTELENYCSKCGIELVKEKNMCSENKTKYCSHRVYGDDDLYCAYCGSLTTYAVKRQKI